MKCQSCGKTIKKIFASGKKRGFDRLDRNGDIPAVFCSEKCAMYYYSLKRVKDCVCENCGEKITDTNSIHLDFEGILFCSTTCAFRHLSIITPYEEKN